ncbi:SRPBCC domain-containing protein [Inquilinus limosus]|uniref:SRPBCC family protein n=1 Tax=Inquilinus limosus TaxID=171674 RepID=UPI003F14CAE9
MRAMAPVETVTQSRIINATPLQAYDAWVNPAKLRRWLAPPPFTCALAETDPKVGGRYRIDVVGGSGERHSTTGVYRELVPGRRIVKSWVYDGPFDAFRGAETEVTVEFREVAPGRTEVTVHHSRTPSQEYADSVHGGWAGCLDELEKLFA